MNPADRPTSRHTADPRQALADHVTATCDSLAGLSVMLRRAPGYLGRFIRTGVPRALSEEDHRILAMHFGVSERALGIRDLWVEEDQAGATGRSRKTTASSPTSSLISRKLA